MHPLDALVGESREIAALRERVGRLLAGLGDRRPPPILIQGETGTGKGLLARAIHQAGPRAAGPFVDVNCAAIPESLLEAEMFGYERGAFTDARQAKRGLLEAAHHGTLFLDEVGLLPGAVQAKLLTALEDRQVRRLGGTRNEPVDVWILAATAEDLAAARREGRFQEALYHRLSVVSFHLPPLRERGRDVVRLAEQFLAQACADYGLRPKRIGPDAEAALLAYPWPGNVRELVNVIERVTLLEEDPVVTARQLDLASTGAGSSPPPPPRRAERGAVADDIRSTLGPGDLLEALRQAGWNVSRAAERLGIPRNTLRYRMEKYRLHPDTPEPAAEPALVPPPARRPVEAPVLPPRPGPPTPAPARWELRRVTLLRAALVPSGPPTPDRYDDLDMIVSKIGTFGGRLEELSANGLVAAFGLEPVEDAPRRAAHAAMAIQKAAERGRAGAEAGGIKLGIHVGEFVVSQAGGVPEIVLEGKQAAWPILETLVERTPSNTIAVSEAAVPFLRPRFELAPADTPPGEATGAHRLVGLDPTALESGRRLARFVGRGRELELLQAQLAAATRGRGQVVGIVGEAGLGKTRLLAELRRSLPDSVTYLEGHCVSYGSAIPYLPLADLLREQCGIHDVDGPDVVDEKVRRCLVEVGLSAEAGAPYLLHLLGLKDEGERLAAVSPEAIQAGIFDTLRQLALRASRQRLLVLAIENLHWIDKPSEEYLAGLVQDLGGAPLLLVATYRPGYRPPWIDKSYATQIALQPLAAPDSLALVTSVLQDQAVPESLTRVILDRAEGNPLFLEELTLAMAGAGEGSTALTVPATIQDVLLARISRLPDEPRWMLQTASVLGREVSRRLLRAVWAGPSAVEPHLRELTRLEFLYEQADGDEPVYVFKHALTWEVAYASLLPGRRRDLHAATGRALEALYADRLDEIQERLAHHYARAEDAVKALPALVRVAERAVRGYAHAEAVTILREAMALADRLPAGARDRTLVDLALREARSLYFLGGFRESLHRLLRHEDRVEGLRDPALAGPYAFWVGHTYSHLGDHERAERAARRAIAEAERCGDTATLGKARYVLARGCFWAGRYAEGVAEGERAVALLAGTAERWWLGISHWGVAFNQGFRGQFAPALAAAAQTQAIGEEIGDPRLQTYAAWTTGWLRAAMGDWAAGIEACRLSLERSPDPVNTADALSFLGGAYLEQGDAGQAIELLAKSVHEWSRFQHRPMLAWFTTLLGEAHLLNGDPARARELAAEGLQIAGGVKFRYGVAWAQRALGRIDRAEGARPAAEGRFREALDTFGSIHAGFEVGRTHLDLAELLRTRGDAATGRHVREAAAIFAALGVPRYQERARRLAEAIAPTA
jgi:DNA-binding NtrC family response regulator/tetratricopeptide (TPR) repeat protein